VPNTPCGEDYKVFKEAENVMFLNEIQ
jgi:hypothetical protein